MSDSDRAKPGDLHPQDWLLIGEALTEYVGPAETHDKLDERGTRALELIGMIREFLELEPEDVNRQTDSKWGGENRR